jgi:hypothetical protein
MGESPFAPRSSSLGNVIAYEELLRCLGEVCHELLQHSQNMCDRLQNLFQGRQTGIPVLMSKPDNSVIDKAKLTVVKRFCVSHMHQCLVPYHLFEPERFS